MIKIKLGDYNDLTVQEVAYREGKGERFGLYLDGGRDGEILMPDKYVPEGTQVGDTLRVFVYLDQEERPIATTEKPLARVDEFAYLQCAWVNQYGAFLHWGVMKDLFCPFREQKKRMEVGLKYIVHIHADEESYRLVASAKVEHYLHDYAEDYDAAARRGEIETAEEETDAVGFRPYHVGDEVELLVWQKTDLGFKVIVDNRYPALIYEDQISSMCTRATACGASSAASVRMANSTVRSSLRASARRRTSPTRSWPISRSTTAAVRWATRATARTSSACFM